MDAAPTDRSPLLVAAATTLLGAMYVSWVLFGLNPSSALLDFARALCSFWLFLALFGAAYCLNSGRRTGRWTIPIITGIVCLLNVAVSIPFFLAVSMADA